MRNPRKIVSRRKPSSQHKRSITIQARSGYSDHVKADSFQDVYWACRLWLQARGIADDWKAIDHREL